MIAMPAVAMARFNGCNIESSSALPTGFAAGFSADAQ
jgi:hypothetical protein